MAVYFGLLVLGAYLLGSVPAAYLVARLTRGIDIRQYGSGNVGAANVVTMVSKWWGIPVIIFDLVKGLVFLFVAQGIGLELYQQVIVAIAAIVGHNWSIFLRFSGGRGGMTTLGIALALPPMNGLVPWEIIVFSVIATIGLLVMHDVAIGVGGGIAVAPLVSWGMGEPLPLTLGFLAMFLIMAIRRMAAPRTAVAASLSTRQVLLNRLLHDRDIKDREAWIHREPVPENPEQPAGKSQKGATE